MRSDLEPSSGLVTPHMRVKGKRPVSHLIAALSGIDGVREMGTLDDPDLD